HEEPIACISRLRENRSEICRFAALYIADDKTASLVGIGAPRACQAFNDSVGSFVQNRNALRRPPADRAQIVGVRVPVIMGERLVMGPIPLIDLTTERVNLLGILIPGQVCIEPSGVLAPGAEELVDQPASFGRVGGCPDTPQSITGEVPTRQLLVHR